VVWLYSFFEAINNHNQIRLNPQQSHSVSAALLREDAMGVVAVFNTLFVLLATLSVIAISAAIISVSTIDIIISLLIILSILISGILILNLIIR
jgi:hypothetical protein